MLCKTLIFHETNLFVDHGADEIPTLEQTYPELAVTNRKAYQFTLFVVFINTNLLDVKRQHPVNCKTHNFVFS